MRALSTKVYDPQLTSLHSDRQQPLRQTPNEHIALTRIGASPSNRSMIPILRYTNVGYSSPVQIFGSYGFRSATLFSVIRQTPVHTNPVSSIAHSHDLRERLKFSIYPHRTISGWLLQNRSLPTIRFAALSLGASSSSSPVQGHLIPMNSRSVPFAVPFCHS